jgi:DNA-binding XRE family transcriptional regulator
MTLREYRTSHGITLDVLAARTGITKTALANIECGGGCRLKTAKAIVDATDGSVSFEDLLVDPAIRNGNGATSAE